MTIKFGVAPILVSVTLRLVEDRHMTLTHSIALFIDMDDGYEFECVGQGLVAHLAVFADCKSRINGRNCATSD